ncbi:MAG: hypothetical protein QM725_02985 [Lacibacter sp.]
MSYVTVEHCGNDHHEWLASIEFYEKDLHILENRLSEIVSKNSSHDALEGAEHFQNQFIIQKNTLQELRHDINEHEHYAKLDAERHAGHMNDAHAAKHDQIKEDFSSFEKIIKELRHEFNNYLSKWM